MPKKVVILSDPERSERGVEEPAVAFSYLTGPDLTRARTAHNLQPGFGSSGKHRLIHPPVFLTPDP